MYSNLCNNFYIVTHLDCFYYYYKRVQNKHIFSKYLPCARHFSTYVA